MFLQKGMCTYRALVSVDFPDTAGYKIRRARGLLFRRFRYGFIIFLFYSNLLMGEFEHSGGGYGRGVAWAIRDVFTGSNFLIAVIASFIGYIFVEFLRKRL